MSKHALLSPSGFQAIMLCQAKPAMERGLPDPAGKDAAEGTAAHELGAMALETDKTAAALIGEIIDVDGTEFVVDAEMAEAVQVYLDIVRDYKGEDGTLFVEQALPIGHITGEDGAEGTGDAIIVRGQEIVVIDLKYGRGVEVQAEMNPQLMLYGLGALEKFDLVGDINRVRMVISQPRISHAPSEFDLPAASLIEWGMRYATPAAERAAQLYASADRAEVEAACNPHEDACRFCRAKASCPALADTVQSALEAEFTDLTTADKVAQEIIVKTSVGAVPVEDLGAKMDAVPLIEMWCKAIRGRVEAQLHVDVLGPRRSSRPGPSSWARPWRATHAARSRRARSSCAARRRAAAATRERERARQLENSLGRVFVRAARCLIPPRRARGAATALRARRREHAAARRRANRIRHPRRRGRDRRFRFSARTCARTTCSTWRQQGPPARAGQRRAAALLRGVGLVALEQRAQLRAERPSEDVKFWPITVRA